MNAYSMASVQHCVTSEDHIQLEHWASDIHTQQEMKVTVTRIVTGSNF